MYEWARDTLTQLTFDPGRIATPVWTPDGRRIVFSSDRAKPGISNLYWVNADGTGEVTRLTDSPDRPDALVVASQRQVPRVLRPFAAPPAGDLMILPMEGDAARGWTPGKPTVFLSTPATEAAPMFSPDGRWIAYASNEAGSYDVYVRPFPGPGGQWRVSTAGGIYPRWSATTHELLLAPSGQGTIMAAPYTVVGDSFRADTPQLWSPTSIQGVSTINGGYDLHPDGKRVATVCGPGAGQRRQDKVVFVFNFVDYLRTIAPGTK